MLLVWHFSNSDITKRKQVLEGDFPQFDAMVTFSSLEHSGLGRYGDSLNPWGDLITMAQAWCLLKPGARALVGIPGKFKNFFSYYSLKK